MVKYYGNIHVYCPGVGADQHLGSNFFQNHKALVRLSISFKFFPSNDIFTIFPIYVHGRPMLTFPYNSSRSPHGHDFYIPVLCSMSSFKIIGLLVLEFLLFIAIAAILDM